MFNLFNALVAAVVCCNSPLNITTWQVPLKDRLDYVAVGRKMLLIDELPQGEVPQYDLDIPEFGAVKIAARGAAPIVEANIKRVEFEISSAY